MEPFTSLISIIARMVMASMEFGTWKVTKMNGLVGLYYEPLNEQPKFVPVYKLADGNFFIGEGITILKQGSAICN